jgi:hypothetical protein
LISATYGAAAAACGTVATVAVVRLAVTALLAAAGDGGAEMFGRAARLPRLARRWLAGFASADLWRWLLVLGLTWWLWSVWGVMDSSLFSASRDRVGGAVPWLNFPGPKVTVVPLARSYDPAPKFALESLLMVWLLTSGRSVAGGTGTVLRAAARWAAVVLVGLALGWRLSDRQFEQSALLPQHLAVLVVLIEAPLTLLIYLHLAAVARQEGAAKLGRSLAALAIAAPAV